MALHKDLSGADLHEPKGIETATVGQVYVANGNGTGSWQSPNTGAQYFLTAQIDNVSDPQSAFVVVPRNGVLRSVRFVQSAATTGTSVVSVYRNGTLQNQTFNVVAGPTGTTGLITFVSPISVVAGNNLEFRTNGAGDGAAALGLTLVLE